MTTKTKTTIQALVQEASDKLKEMGGGEQRIGNLHALARECGSRNETDFMVDLGEALEKVGLQLTTAPGNPGELYATVE